jgi:adiponectin receptor
MRLIRARRFIPPNKWPLILSSLFALHNETRMFFYSRISLRFVKLLIVNIYTHLIPLVLWTISSIPFFSLSPLSDTPETTFTAFALMCLFFSTVWHTMAGCAHAKGMEFCATVDYVGIGWYAVTSIFVHPVYLSHFDACRLISASVGTVVYYGFRCRPDVGKCFLALCFLTGLAGNTFPFMDWFNQYHYRVRSLLCLSFSPHSTSAHVIEVAYRLLFDTSLFSIGPSRILVISVRHSSNDFFHL